jgi:tetratricopeptide (TPR) repeat protein
MTDRIATSRVGYLMAPAMPLLRSFGAVLLAAAIAACGGKKGESTTPSGSTGSDSQSMNDTGDPDFGTGGTGGTGSTGGTGDGSGGGGGSTPGGEPGGDGTDAPGDGVEAPVVITPPNFDPDPAEARAQVESHLAVARAALTKTPPDPDGALAEARKAIAIDAANVDAAAMIALSYFHKKLYDTAELVLDDLYKRDAAKRNANVNYVYGLVYDATKRPEQAQLAYEKAVSLNPSHTSALTNLGVHQLKNTRYADAQRTFERLIRELGRDDAITRNLLGSAYRGRSADYPAGSSDRDRYVRSAEAEYKRALQANPNYGPAYYNLGLLYLDNDPFPGVTDALARLNAAKSYFEQYKNMPGVDMKLYDDRMKDVNKAIKRAEKQKK